VEAAAAALERMLETVRGGRPLGAGDVEEIVRGAGGGAQAGVGGRVGRVKLETFRPGVYTEARTAGQARYIRAMVKHELTFCIGPAGTGKTFLAVAVALSHLKSGEYRRIVLARPAVEAGERLGFLPGDMYAKVNPYLRPLYDSLGSLMDAQTVRKYLDAELIEVLPLAFMRGRTLEDAFIILDEAQNCTGSQMKTFLTRMGVGSRIVVTGDITQIDLPDRSACGLLDVIGRLRGVPGVAVVELGEQDIVRHALVRDIVKAYERGPRVGPEEERGPEGGGSDGT
jgi:phosphate starvation-inducible PhoH-like protein